MPKNMREVFNEARDAAFIDSNDNRVTYEAFGAKRMAFEEFYKRLVK